METLETIRQFKINAGQTAPECPTVPSDTERILQVRLLVEEALEMAEAMGVHVAYKECNNCNQQPISVDSFDYSIKGPYNFVGVMDAACDIFWVGVGGPVVLSGLTETFEVCLSEVNNSNMSKFIDGHKCQNTGKWIKGPSYRPADIKSILGDL